MPVPKSITLPRSELKTWIRYVRLESYISGLLMGLGLGIFASYCVAQGWF